jgi:hypothetical protein
MKKALLIGINDYPIQPLRGCIKDVRTLHSVLERNGDGSKNFDILPLEDVQSSNKAMEAIEELFKGDEDFALLYYSGHGFVNTVGAELVFPDDCCKDGYHKGLQMSDIMQVVNRSKVKNKVVILDCCHAGNMGENIRSAESELSEGVSILTACRKDESALEMGGHGVFTELLCEALRGGAADFSGNITMGGIYAYIDRSFGCWEQRPVFKTNICRFAPLRTVVPKISNEVIRELRTLFNDPTEVFQLDPSFEYTNVPECELTPIEPYAQKEHIEQFKTLQKLQSIGFVEPIEEEYMYYAAMHSTGCRLTALGQYYWRLVINDRI